VFGLRLPDYPVFALPVGYGQVDLAPWTAAETEPGESPPKKKPGPLELFALVPELWLNVATMFPLHPLLLGLAAPRATGAETPSAAAETTREAHSFMRSI
jgi:hypothetical protein